MELQSEQRLASSGAHGAEIGQVDAGAAAQLEREHSVGEARVPGPRSRLGYAGAEAEISRAIDDGLRDPRELSGIERSVAVHETHDLRFGGKQPGEASRTEAASRFVHHPCAARRRDLR